MPAIIDVIIPAFNEEASIGKVIEEIPLQLVRNIIVCDNNSTDRTSDVVKALGAKVLHENRKGYGWACLKGIEHCSTLDIPPDIVVFIDGDYSDFPSQMPLVVEPIINDNADLVIGSRVLGKKEKGSMMPQQIFGNWLATTLIKLFYNQSFTDLGPFRAIKWQALQRLKMEDKTFGWTVEMQVKAAKLNLHCCEVSVDYRKRIGVSKVSGTIKGTILAGYKILWTIFKLL